MGLNLGENGKGVRPQKDKSQRKSRSNQGREGQRVKSQGLSTPRTLTPPPTPQEAQVTLEPVKTSETPGLPRTCPCESPKMLTHMILKMHFFHQKKSKSYISEASRLNKPRVKKHMS